MRSTVLVIAGAVALSIFPVVTAEAAPHRYFDCPADARSTVRHNGDPAWVATNQSSRPVNARVEIIGTETALVCVYAMFGTEYCIYRRPDAGFGLCSVQPSRRGFDCVPA